MTKNRLVVLIGFLAFAMFLPSTPRLWAGPVILGGDDLTDHGSRLAGANIDGWLYIENAIRDLLTRVTRPGPYTVDIVAIGSSGGQAGCPGGDTSGLPADIPDPGANLQNAGSAICSVAVVLGKTINFFNGTDRLNLFFDGLATGTISPAIIWIAGTGADNDLGAADAAVLNVNATAINAFVLSGGGLMAHGSGPNAYGWLSALLPGIVNTVADDACDNTTLMLTPDGIVAFPTLTNSDIQAGPCHSNFSGDLGGLHVLATDVDDQGQPRNIIIGGGIGTEIVPGAILADIHPQSCPNPLKVDRSTGVLPVAIVGTADFDITQVNPASIQLVGVAPLRWSVEDVATPFIGALNDALDCNVLGSDGFDDLTLKFNNQEIAAALGPVSDGEVLLLTLNGELFNGSLIEAVDVVVVLDKN